MGIWTVLSDSGDSELWIRVGIMGDHRGKGKMAKLRDPGSMSLLCQIRSLILGNLVLTDWFIP